MPIPRRVWSILGIDLLIELRSLIPPIDEVTLGIRRVRERLVQGDPFDALGFHRLEKWLDHLGIKRPRVEQKDVRNSAAVEVERGGIGPFEHLDRVIDKGLSQRLQRRFVADRKTSSVGRIERPVVEIDRDWGDPVSALIEVFSNRDGVLARHAFEQEWVAERRHPMALQCHLFQERLVGRNISKVGTEVRFAQAQVAVRMVGQRVSSGGPCFQRGAKLWSTIELVCVDEPIHLGDPMSFERREQRPMNLDSRKSGDSRSVGRQIVHCDCDPQGTGFLRWCRWRDGR